MNSLVTKTGQMGLMLLLCLGMTACNSEDFFEKEAVLENALSDPNARVASNTSGGSNAGSTSGSTDGSTSGGSSSGTTSGSTDGSTSGGSSSGTTSGSTTGSTSGGSTSGSTSGGITYEVNERFKQEAKERALDIMWVIDDSASMEIAQENLANNFDIFIKEFIDRKIDFKMGITTTDTSSSTRKGRMVPGSVELLNSQAAQQNPAKFIEDFRKLVDVGTSGSGYEKGLEATEGFMQKHAASFVRKDAYLAVVILSDEEDQSPKSPRDYSNYLKSFKDQQGLVKIYSIVDVKKVRKPGYGITIGFERYAEASQHTAGLVDDIFGVFHHILAEMGDNLMALLDSFALAHEPVAGSLKVYVNNELVSNYTYNSVSRSIKFDQGSLPPVGAEIKVNYLRK